MRTFFQQSAAFKQFSLVITLIVSVLITACSPKNESVAPAAQVEVSAAARVDNTVADSNATLKSVATFPIGVSLKSTLLAGNAKANQIFRNEFNSRTVPVFMNIEYAPGKFNFTELDNSVKMAEGQNIRLHGHCLVYHMAAPDWLAQFKGNTAEFEAAVKNHIQTVVGRQKGKIKSWDVVNEVIDWRTGQLTNTAFRKLYASDEQYLTFVKHCFEWAHEADPTALLFWNEDVYEMSTAKQAAMTTIMKDFKKSGTPINGLGTQMHITINTLDQGIRTSLQTLAATGLLIHLSELDIAINPNHDNNLTVTDQLLQAQQLKFQTAVAAYKQLIPASQQYGITLWGLGDSDSWLITATNQREMPLLFDAQYTKKPAYFSFMNALKK